MRLYANGNSANAHGSLLLPLRLFDRQNFTYPRRFARLLYLQPFLRSSTPSSLVQTVLSAYFETNCLITIYRALDFFSSQLYQLAHIWVILLRSFICVKPIFNELQ